MRVENENKLYAKLKEGFALTIEWNKYRCQISNQTATSNLNYIIDPTFDNVNRLFVLCYENEEDRTYFSKDYTTSIEIKDYKV